MHTRVLHYRRIADTTQVTNAILHIFFSLSYESNYRRLLLHTKVGFLLNIIATWQTVSFFEDNSVGYQANQSRVISITCNIIFYLALTSNNPP